VKYKYAKGRTFKYIVSTIVSYLIFMIRIKLFQTAITPMKRKLSSTCMLILYLATIYISGIVHLNTVGIHANGEVHEVCCAPFEAGNACNCPPCVERGVCSCSCENDISYESIEQLKKHASLAHYSQAMSYPHTSIVLLGDIIAKKRIIKYARYHYVAAFEQINASIVFVFQNIQSDILFIPACMSLILYITDTSPPLA
jgi:hypothetical protein